MVIAAYFASPTASARLSLFGFEPKASSKALLCHGGRPEFVFLYHRELLFETSVGQFANQRHLPLINLSSGFF